MTYPGNSSIPPPPPDRWDEHPNDPEKDPAYSLGQNETAIRHLRTLATFWLAWAVVSALMACGTCIFTSAHIFMVGNLGISKDASIIQTNIYFALSIICLCQPFIAVMVFDCLRSRTNYSILVVLTAISLLGFPLGTLLGFFTFRILRQPAVKRLFP